MRATLLDAPRQVSLADVPDPAVQAPTDAVVRVVASCICGSDLWPYRGVAERPPGIRIGHEFVGVVEEVGADVGSVAPGDFVVAPFVWSDGTCVHCRAGFQTSCLHGGGWGSPDREGLLVDGGQGERVRVPQADGTLVPTPEPPDPALVPALLALSDVMGTGHHAALAAGVREGSTVVVVGDGAVGLCGVLASSRLGAERVVLMSRHAPRQDLGRRFGATDVVAERGDEGVERVLELTGGVGADAVLECVGTSQSMEQAVRSARPGATVGYVGVPYGEAPLRAMFGANVGLRGGVAPVRRYLPELLEDVLAGQLDPGPVFDLELPLDRVADGYAAMDERRAVKVLLRP
ncbi:zinc-dependent alcohol dehydrogenase family protein [Vallicoccus soli]|uniref:IMP dehydrogenase n=1 Tax=Vallicoccus soli TaxID=2339232 RepID=A0A3A3YTM8_9ACTN|nr:zinc-dependent alcohol dehydrogenase family protein [Vallicoccus soli]RJK94834.1 IMP dehydrogenase [Vallicoccus soli]